MTYILKIAIDNFNRWRSLMLITVFISLLLSGCQTAAQRKMDWLQAEHEVLKQRDKICYQNIKQKYAQDKDVLNYMEPWLNIDQDNSINKGFFDGGGKIPKDYEVKIIVGIYNDISNCRAQMIEGVKRIDPNMVPIYVSSYRADDLSMAELIDRKISWQEASDRKIALENDTEQKIRAELWRLEQEAEMSRSAELANKRSDAQSGTTSIVQSQQDALDDRLRKQQMINKPITTHCVNRDGNMVCHSY